jgi:hypothetical protein
LLTWLKEIIILDQLREAATIPLDGKNDTCWFQLGSFEKGTKETMAFIKT